MPTTFYKSLKKPDGWEKTLKDSLNSSKPDRDLMQKASQALYDDCTLIPTTYYVGVYATQPYVHDTGLCECGNSQLKPQNTWLSK
jgi:hypothetical protein